MRGVFNRKVALAVATIALGTTLLTISGRDSYAKFFDAKPVQINNVTSGSLNFSLTAPTFRVASIQASRALIPLPAGSTIVPGQTVEAKTTATVTVRGDTMQAKLALAPVVYSALIPYRTTVSAVAQAGSAALPAPNADGSYTLTQANNGGKYDITATIETPVDLTGSYTTSSTDYLRPNWYGTTVPTINPPTFTFTLTQVSP